MAIYTHSNVIKFFFSALGLVAAKSSLVGGLFNGGGGSGSGGGLFNGGGSHGGYGQSYGYNSAPTTLTTSYPTTYTSQTYVPQQPQAYGPPPQPAYVQQPQPTYVQQPAYVAVPAQNYGPPPQQQQFGGPIGAALSWKAGLVNGITGGISNSVSHFGFPSHQQPAPVASYSYNTAVAAEVPSAQIGPIAPPAPAGPNKPLYVVCDN